MKEEIKLSYYPNGNKCIETPCLNKKIHGVQTFWNPNETIQTKISYKNGMLHGPDQRWYYTGEIKKETTYKNNVLHGMMVEFEYTKFVSINDFLIINKIKI
jgi:antitoxin component YwqK of YwqJK toxin-antitoxin module